MLIFAVLIFICPSLILADDFHNVNFSPLTLTSVPYLNGEIAVYKHVNQSRYYLPPLAILHLNDTQVLYNRLTSRYALRLGLVLFTKQLHDTVLDYLQKNLRHCENKTDCQIKMIPIDRLRVVWKRLHHLSAEYQLDSSWISNTILLNTVYFNIYCHTFRACANLEDDIKRHPEIVDGLELEYNTPTEKHTRQEIKITGTHVMRTNMFAALKQMPAAADSNTRYLLVDDMNSLISEVLANVEMQMITDAGYVSYDDQSLMRDLLKSRMATNQEVLLGHKARQWESVYWNPDNIRPDVTVQSINDYLTRTHNEKFNETQANRMSSSRQLDESNTANAGYSFNDTSNKTASQNDASGSKYADDKRAKATLTNTQSGDIRAVSSSTSASSSSQDLDGSSSHSRSASHSSGGGSSGFFGIGARGSSSSSSSSDNQNSQLNYRGRSNSQSESNSEYTNNQQSDLRAEAGLQHNINANAFANSSGKFQSINDIRAKKIAEEEYRKAEEMDNFAANKLDTESLKKYNENRQYLAFNGSRFEVKQVTAYRVNLGQFHESLNLVSKSIVVQRINSTHAVPIRPLGEPIVLTPVIEQFKINMDEKLIDLKNSLLKSIQQTVADHRAESRSILLETMVNTTSVIGEALAPVNSANKTNNDFRVLMKKALTKIVSLQDIGVFDNGILDYYRHDANPITNISIVSLQPLRIGLHFSNAYIEGMVCDDSFFAGTARTICRIMNPADSSRAINFATNGIYDQKLPTCRFKTAYVNDLVPCPYIINELICDSNAKTLQNCSFKRSTRKDAYRPNEHVLINC